MKEFSSKINKIFFPFTVLCIVSCGATLPLQEITTAKQEVSRAKLFNAEKYSKSDYDESKTNLYNAHESVSASKPDLKKAAQFAETSAQKARLATKKSLPNYVKDLQQEADAALESANQALADSLSSEIYEKANLLKIEADELTKNADTRLSNSKEAATDDSLYNDYEKGIKRYKESIVESEKARDMSLAQTQALIDSTSDIESNLDLVERYSKNDKATLSQVNSLRSEYKASVDSMEAGNLRDGFKKSEAIRTKSNELISAIILPYAKERIKLATSKIEDADKFLSTEKEENNSSAIAKDNLSASKEAFNASVDLLSKERYYDSIQQSNESIRLAEEILNSNQNKNLANNKIPTDERTQKAIEDADNKDSFSSKKKSSLKNTNQDKKENWKKHTVRKTIPPETLWRIAASKDYLGNKDLWKEIYKANKKTISNPNKIYPNQVILIPPKKK